MLEMSLRIEKVQMVFRKLNVQFVRNPQDKTVRPVWMPKSAADRAAASCAIVAILMIAIFGSIVAVKAPLWDEVDEIAHVSYVQNIATTGHLPVLYQSHLSEQIIAIARHVYPHKVTFPATTKVKGGYDYEAFQPPLAYMVDVPVFELANTFIIKVKLLRFFGLLLLIVSVFLSIRLSRLLLKTNWWFGFAALATAAAIPGIVVRVATVSNLPLTMLLVVACVTEFVVVLVRAKSHRLVSAGVLLGLAILTNLFSLDLIPLAILSAGVAIWRSHSKKEKLRNASLPILISASVAGAIVAPWILFNESHYHHLTGSAVAQALQLGPNGAQPHFTLHYTLDFLFSWILAPVVPQEWWGVAGHPVNYYANNIVDVLIIPVAIYFAIPTKRSSCTRLILVGVYLSNVLLCIAMTYFDQWPCMISRYTDPTLIFLALAGIAGALENMRSRALVVVGLVGLLAFVGLTWIPLASQIQLL